MSCYNQVEFILNSIGSTSGIDTIKAHNVANALYFISGE